MIREAECIALVGFEYAWRALLVRHDVHRNIKLLQILHQGTVVMSCLFQQHRHLFERHVGTDALHERTKTLTRLLKSKRWTGLKALMAFEQGRGNKAGNMSLFAHINANIQRLILEHGDRLQVRRTFSWVRHRLDLLSQTFPSTAFITNSLTCKEARGRGKGRPPATRKDEK